MLSTTIQAGYALMSASTLNYPTYYIRSEEVYCWSTSMLLISESVESGLAISASAASTGNSISSSASQNSSDTTSMAFSNIYSIFYTIDYSQADDLSPTEFILALSSVLSLRVAIFPKFSAFFFALSFYSFDFSLAYSTILPILALMCSIFFSRLPILFCRASSFLTAATELLYSSQKGSPSTMRQNMISQKVSMPFSSSTSSLYSLCCLRWTVLRMRRLTQCSNPQARLPSPTNRPANLEPSFSCCLRLTQASMGREKVRMSMVNIFWKGNMGRSIHSQIKIID